MSALRKLMAAATVLAVLAVPACERAAHEPEELAAVAARIHAEPDREAEILDEHGLTRDEFHDRVWAISEDPEAARRYAEAIEREIDTAR